MTEVPEELEEEDALLPIGVVPPDEILPLYADGEQSMFQPYVFDLASSPLNGAGASTTVALVVLLRKDGLLVAVPEIAIPPEARAAAQGAKAGNFTGPSTVVSVPLALMDEITITAWPTPVAGSDVSVVLADFSLDALNYLKLVAGSEDLENITTFEFPETFHSPTPKDLVAQALSWISSLAQAWGAPSVLLGRRTASHSCDPSRQKNSTSTSSESSSSRWYRRQRKTKGDSGSVSRKPRAHREGLARGHNSAGKSSGAYFGNGGSSSEAARQVVSIEEATFVINCHWIRSQLESCRSGSEDASPSKFLSAFEAAPRDLCAAGDGRDVLRAPLGIPRHGCTIPGSHPNTISGEVRWLRQDEGLGLHHMASGPLHEPHARRKSCGGNGLPEPSLCVPGTGSSRQRKSTGGPLTFPSRGPAAEPFLWHPKPFARTASQRWVPERNGCDILSAQRTGRTKGNPDTSSQANQEKPKAKSKAKGKGKGRQQNAAQQNTEEEQ